RGGFGRRRRRRGFGFARSRRRGRGRFVRKRARRRQRGGDRRRGQDVAQQPTHAQPRIWATFHSPSSSRCSVSRSSLVIPTRSSETLTVYCLPKRGPGTRLTTFAFGTFAFAGSRGGRSSSASASCSVAVSPNTAFAWSCFAP